MQWLIRMLFEIQYNCVKRYGSLLPGNSCLHHDKIDHIHNGAFRNMSFLFQTALQ